MTIPLPMEFVLFPLLGLLLYSACLNGKPIFDDMEILPAAGQFSWKWESIRKAARPLSSLLMALEMKWPGSHRGVHVTNVLLHSVNGFLVEHIALALGCDYVQSLCAGFFFVGMPFAANTVGYMSGQSGLLVGLFGLTGVLAILSGWGWIAIPCLVLAYLSKEDGLGFAATFLALGAYRQQLAVVGSILLLITAAVIFQRKHLVRLFRSSGDKEMAAVGLPVSYPQPQHGFTVLVETVRRIPFWLFGSKQSPYHGSGIPVPRFTKTLAAIAVLLAVFILIYR